MLQSALHLRLRLRRPQTELGPDRLYAYLEAIWERRDVPEDVLDDRVLPLQHNADRVPLSSVH